MSRNTETRFSQIPGVNIARSKFKIPFSHKTTFNTGELIPFYLQEVLPGDTHKLKTSLLARMQSLITPVMDNMYLDTYYFFVPNRLTWEHSKQFFGENTETKWTQSQEYVIPQVSAPVANEGETGWLKGTIADHFGIPTNVDNFSVNALPFRAYALIVNEFFRDQNNQDPAVINLTDSDLTGSNGDDYINDIALGGKPFIAAKYHDYFTSALPGPQKGDPVTISIGSFDSAVYGTGKGLALSDGIQAYPFGSQPFSNVDPSWDADWRFLHDSKSGNMGKNIGELPDQDTGARSAANAVLGVPTKEMMENWGYDPELTGLTTNIQGGALVTINELRTAFQLQRMLEKDARGGTRYIEILKSHFGVTSPDARLQRPEYLGGTRVPINVNQVLQTSETNNTPQGNTAAYSLTNSINNDFTHSFVEHGYIIGLAVVRYDHTYQQGLNKIWSRKTKYDFYWPTFANLGEMSIKNKEIYLQSDLVVDKQDNPINDGVFGYQEAWAEYRYMPNIVSGEMRSNYAQSLDSWHLADEYSDMPYLSNEFIREDKNNVNRIIAVSENVADQFLMDCYVEDTATRPMPVYSVPGLMDHN